MAFEHDEKPYEFLWFLRLRHIFCLPYGGLCVNHRESGYNTGGVTTGHRGARPKPSPARSQGPREASVRHREYTPPPLLGAPFLALKIRCNLENHMNS